MYKTFVSTFFKPVLNPVFNIIMSPDYSYSFSSFRIRNIEDNSGHLEEDNVSIVLRRMAPK